MNNTETEDELQPECELQSLQVRKFGCGRKNLAM
jgi:hypothetical protein